MWQAAAAGGQAVNMHRAVHKERGGNLEYYTGRHFGTETGQ